MSTKLSYVIEFVADMDRAVKFYRDVVGFPLKFQSPGWSEFATGETTLGLHPASEKNPSGKVEFGFHVPDLPHFYNEMRAKGIDFPMPPTRQDFGGMLAQFEDSEGARVSVAGQNE
jgi:predicted enzyme related to lactoylglutathione lyase